MAKLTNLAKMSTGTTGTGTITLLAAVTGFLSFNGSGVLDGDVVSYGITDGNESEVGVGVYTHSGTTLSRSVIKSTNSNNALSLSGNAQVFVTPLASDFDEFVVKSVFTNDVSADFTIKSGFDYHDFELRNILPELNYKSLHVSMSTDNGANFNLNLSTSVQYAMSGGGGNVQNHGISGSSGVPLIGTGFISQSSVGYGVNGTLRFSQKSGCGAQIFGQIFLHDYLGGLSTISTGVGSKVVSTVTNIRFALNSGLIESGWIALKRGNFS